MENQEILKRFREFFESVYYQKIVENVRNNKFIIVIDFNELSRFDLELSELVLESPNSIIRLAESTILELNLGKDLSKFRVRFSNLPLSQRILIKDVRSYHIGKLVYVEGVVKQKSNVRPKAEFAKFECPVCGNVINLAQDENKFKNPRQCGCGYKGKFKLLEKTLIDYQGIVLEELSEDLDSGEQPERINNLLIEDLVSPLFVKKTNPGNKVRIIGIVTEVPIINQGGQSVKFDIVVEANYVQPLDESYGDVEITAEDEEKIIEISRRPALFPDLINSVAPGIYGHDNIKQAILLQFVGGVKKKGADGVMRRGDIHVLLVGDPGAGKSQMLKRAMVIAPKSRYVSGKGASGAGLTAAVVKDEFLGGWSLEAGALVLANEGICLIDELDKMTTEDRSAMHEALEQQSITISKANIQATLQAQTTVLAAANPKMGRFNQFEPYVTQINLPPPLISRFDLIFPIVDKPDTQKDDKLANFVLRLHKQDEKFEPPVPTDLLRKYISYCRERMFPKLTEGAIEEIKNYYVATRNAVSNQENSNMAITTRQLEALIRLSEAVAKIRLANEVTRDDSKFAIKLLESCLSDVGIDPKTGKVDIDLLSSGISQSQRSSLLVVKQIITDLEKELGQEIPVTKVYEKSKEKGINEEIIDESLDKLKRSGDIFEPKKGKIQKI